MEVYSLLQDLDLKFYKWEKGIYDAHKHNFFEFVYIIKGQGIHTINNKPYTYKKDDFFLLIPDDVHHFEVNETTEFHVLLFNKIYFNRENVKQGKLIDFSMIFNHLEFILLNASYIKQPIFTDSSERTFIEVLMKHIQSEYEKKNTFFETVIQNTVVHILCLIARKIREEVFGEFLNNGADSNITEVIFYIQDNIYDTEKIKVSNLASRFNKSRNLFGSYFKINTGFSTKEYILNYKCNLVKNKLLYTNYSIGEIAYSLGFTDENHLNKFLKIRLGMTASAFRKLNLNSSLEK